MLGSQLEISGEGEHLRHVSPTYVSVSIGHAQMIVIHADVTICVSFSRKCRHGIRSKPERAVHARCEVEAEERQRWVGHGIDVAPDEVPLVLSYSETQSKIENIRPA